KKVEISKLGEIATSPSPRYDAKLRKSVKPPQPLEGRKVLLAKNQAAIAKLREALSQDYAAPGKYGDLGANFFPAFANHRELARMLSFASRTYADLGQKDKAAECAVDSIELGILAAHRSHLIGELVGIACEAIGRKPLWELADGLDTKTARAAATRLEALEPKRYSFQSVLLDERDYTQSNSYTMMRGSAWEMAQLYTENEMAESTMVMMPDTGGYEKPSVAQRTLVRSLMTAQLLWYTKKHIFAESGRYMSELAEQAKLPYDPKRPGPRMPNDPLNATLMPVFAQAGQKDTAARAETALMRAYLALRAYRLEKGSYPATLAELVSAGYLKALPDDPFAPRFGQPFGYRREAGDKFKLWSCGPDGDDDNGRAIVAKNENGNTRSGRYVQSGDEGDLVARVNTY
uniref:type II secretion system protein GspG n=1 Tax=Armatimonas sp. TaxID=1872638 RepID=UPI00286A8445